MHRNIDAQIESHLAEYGTTSLEYFGFGAVPSISRLKLPPDTMDAAEFLATIDEIEQQLNQARESVIAQARLVEQISKTAEKPNPDILKSLVQQHDEVDAIYGQLFHLSHRVRVIDALAFRTKLATLLDLKMNQALCSQKTRARMICRLRR